eukprot:s3994_g6.t1
MCQQEDDETMRQAMGMTRRPAAKRLCVGIAITDGVTVKAFDWELDKGAELQLHLKATKRECPGQWYKDGRPVPPHQVPRNLQAPLAGTKQAEPKPPTQHDLAKPATKELYERWKRGEVSDQAVVRISSTDMLAVFQATHDIPAEVMHELDNRDTFTLQPMAMHTMETTTEHNDTHDSSATSSTAHPAPLHALQELVPRAQQRHGGTRDAPGTASLETSNMDPGVSFLFVLTSATDNEPCMGPSRTVATSRFSVGPSSDPSDSLGIETDRFVTTRLRAGKMSVELPDWTGHVVNTSYLRMISFSLHLLVLLTCLGYASDLVTNKYPNAVTLFSWPIFFARLGGMACAIYSALLFLSMSRGLLSLLSRCLPKHGRNLWFTFLDSHKDLHIECGKALVFYSALHTVGHCIGTVPGVLQKSAAELNALLGCAQEEPPYVLHMDLSIFHWPKNLCSSLAAGGQISWCLQNSDF